MFNAKISLSMKPGVPLLTRCARKLPFLKAREKPGPEKKRQIWSIGIYTGVCPTELQPAGNVINPVLTHESVTDVPALFVADPFMLNVDRTWHMFFEVFNKRTGKGEIGLATSEDAIGWQYQRIVLTEAYHLSYPHVFEWEHSFYMIAESYQAHAIRLYRAKHFPHGWTHVADLLAGEPFVDPSIFRVGEKWWLMTDMATPPLEAGTLRLFYAADLVGPWIEHPKSPVISGNPHIARPAGRVTVFTDHVMRFTQDCSPLYGTHVRAFKITTLTTTDYDERAFYSRSVLEPSGEGWNKLGMHHIDPHLLDDGQWIACVDGWNWEP